MTDEVTRGPIGELRWLLVEIMDRAATERIVARLDSDGLDISPFRGMEEVAIWYCRADNGQPWCRIGDARVVRDACRDAKDLAAGDRITPDMLNWWVEALPRDAFPIELPIRIEW